MEIKSTLQKPYTEDERMDFLVKQNHNYGYEIKESETALEAWGYTEEEIAQKERERINMLSLTAADVERAIYKAKGMDFEDIIELVSNLTLTPSLSLGEGEVPIDVKALKIELKANNFYRGNPYIDQVGALLGFTSEMLDRFFETKDYHYLISEPENSTTEEVADADE